MPETPVWVGETDRAVHRPGPPVWSTVIGVAYTVLAVAALSRSGCQLATGATAGRAWIAVLLSGLAGVLYVVAAIGLRRGTPRAVQISRWCLIVELCGVVLVSVVELVVGGYGKAAVWTGFGAGYGYLPILLPLLGLWMIHRSGGPPLPEKPNSH